MSESAKAPGTETRTAMPHGKREFGRFLYGAARLAGFGLAGFALSLPSILPGAARAAAKAATAPDKQQISAADNAPAPAGKPLQPHWSPLPAPPAGAPNILLVLTDDVGFAAASTFGGPVPTPNLDRLAKNGLRYNNFHTTAMCSPTRAALLTGRNHHAVGFGAIADMSMGFPGYDTQLPASTRTVAEILKRNGYATAMFGKLHLTPDWQRGLTGPYTQWPIGLGFDYFYGFIAADSDQWHPTLVRGTNLVDTSDRPSDLLLDQDMAEDAIRWIHQAKADRPDRPFFAYFSTGSAHAPNQAPEDWIARFKGRFDKGWDSLRAEIVARQKAGGLIPASARVTARPGLVPAWSSLSPDQKRLNARYMEVYAAQLAFQDAQIGKMLDELRRMGELDNTLVLFIQGDNGASGEGGPEGSLNELRKLSQAKANFTPEEINDLDRLGGPDSYQIYQAGWAWATNAPFPYFKQVASHLGGTRNGLVISWPKGVNDAGRIVSRFQHVADITPTLLEITRIALPGSIDGVAQRPMDGISLADTLKTAAPAEKPRTQYFEILGNRAIYKDGWWANTAPGRMPWEARSRMKPEDFEWELYDLRGDFAQARNLAGRYPQKLAEMKALWQQEAERNNVYPLRAELDIGEMARLARPRPNRDEYVFWGPNVHLPWTGQPDLATGSFSIAVEFAIGDGKDNSGVLMASGSAMAGWMLMLEDGLPILYHAATEAKADKFRIAAGSPLAPGRHELRVTFTADDDRIGSGGQAIISVDGKDVAGGRIARRALRTASSNELFDVGRDTGAPVVVGHKGQNPFEGELTKLVVRAGE